MRERCTFVCFAGGMASGVQVAISMSNTGGAWDNAKKYIERATPDSDLQGKGSDIHKVSSDGVRSTKIGLRVHGFCCRKVTHVCTICVPGILIDASCMCICFDIFFVGGEGRSSIRDGGKNMVKTEGLSASSGSPRNRFVVA